MKVNAREGMVVGGGRTMRATRDKVSGRHNHAGHKRVAAVLAVLDLTYDVGVACERQNVVLAQRRNR